MMMMLIMKVKKLISWMWILSPVQSQALNLKLEMEMSRLSWRQRGKEPWKRFPHWNVGPWLPPWWEDRKLWQRKPPVQRKAKRATPRRNPKLRFRREWKKKRRARENHMQRHQTWMRDRFVGMSVAGIVSGHLCWTCSSRMRPHFALPLPLTQKGVAGWSSKAPTPSHGARSLSLHHLPWNKCASTNLIWFFWMCKLSPPSLIRSLCFNPVFRCF